MLGELGTGFALWPPVAMLVTWGLPVAGALFV